MRRYTYQLLIFALLLLIAGLARAAETTATGIPLDTEWKKKVFAYAQAEVQHCAWGLAHSERDYQGALVLADKEKLDLDRDVLFATAFLHDVGGIGSHQSPGVDHAVRSAQIAEPLLKEYGFPMEKFPLVKDMILGHTYYGPLPQRHEALAFRDADILDFMGQIGVARIVAVSQEIGGDKANEQLPNMIGLVEKFSKEMPEKLSLAAAKELAPARVAEMKSFLEGLKPYTLDGKAL